MPFIVAYRLHTQQCSTEFAINVRQAWVR